MKKLLVYIIAVALLFTNTNIVAMADTVSVNELTVSGNEEEIAEIVDVSENDDSVSENEDSVPDDEVGVSDNVDIPDNEASVSDNEISVSQNEGSVTDEVVEEDINLTEARDSLKKLASEQPIMALVYLSDAYEIKEEPNEESRTIFVAKSGQTVFVEDFAFEDGVVWYQVRFVVAGEGEEIIEHVGYVEKHHLAYSDERLIEWEEKYLEFAANKMSLSIGDFQPTASGYADVAQFPASYHSGLNALKAAHPNWIFVAMNVGRNWDECVNEQLGNYSWIYYNQPAEFRGAQINSTWYYASREGIAYYMDPRNFLTEANVFQFEQNTYNASYHTQSALQTFLNKTFMAGKVPGDTEGRTYANVIWNSGRSRGLSPFNLAARVVQEQGVNGNSAMISGAYPGFENLYNYYNIGASGTSNAEVLKNGLTYARNQGWDTRVKSLNGGAAFIGNGYILQGQDTLYLQKFDVGHGSSSLHQYMQNIMAPYTEGRSMKTMYTDAGSLNSNFVFKIPVFKNMPGEIVEKVTLDKTSVELEIYHDKEPSTLQLQGTVYPEELQYMGKWKSSNTKVATVDSNGLVTAIGVGTAKITFSAGGKSASCTVVVKVPLQGIAIVEKSLDLYVGKSKVITAQLKPEDTTEEAAIVWSSSNEAVAVVKDGVVKGVGPGVTFITATVVGEKGTFKAQIVVTVEDCRVTFYNEDGNELSNSVVEYGQPIGEFPELADKEGYVFSGWYTEPNGAGSKLSEETNVYGSIQVYPYFITTDQKFFVKAVGNQIYTGSAIKPEVEVYDGEHLLTKNVDYTVSYSNNKNVNLPEGKVPTITVKGKGNYTGTQKITFNIVPKSIEDGDIEVDNLLYAYSGKVIKPNPVVYRNGKKLKKGTDYTVSYPETGDYAYKNFGNYKIVVQGIKGYEGTKEINLTISQKVLMSKVSVKKIPNQEYDDGKEICPNSSIILTYKGKTLVENEDYTVTYRDNKEIGTATAIITAVGDSDYIGQREITFKITGISLKKAKISGITSKVYDGTEITLADFPEFAYTYQKNSASIVEPLEFNKDYTVDYQKNDKKGTATIVFTGIGRFTGTVKKTFKISAFNLKNNEENRVTVDETPIQVSYQKDNNKPKVTVYFTNGDGKKTILQESVDYTLSYKNNKAVTTEETVKIPVIVIKGKGNFTGTYLEEIPFTILGTDIKVALEEGMIRVDIPDINYQIKKTNYKPSVSVYDGKKKLKANKDYQIVEYTSTNVTEYADASENRNANRYFVTLQGINSYSGTIEVPYHLYQTKISKAKFEKISPQTFDYVGEEGFCPVPKITFQNGKNAPIEDLELGKDFEIVSYTNNKKVGTAKVTVKGIGNYGGTKTLSFKINKRLLESSK